MQYRRLGKSDLEVPAVIFGAWAIGGWNWGGSDDGLAVRAIQASIDAGATAIDTAPVYGFGKSEHLVARAIQGRRDRVLLLTKVGLRWDDESGEFYFQTAGEDGKPVRVHRNLQPASIQLEVERSLERLGTDRIDLLQVHWPDPRVPVEETMRALAALQKAGKVRAIGVSNYPPMMMDEAIPALGAVPLASNQPKYSLVHRDAERELLPYCRKHDIGVIVYSPLEQGLLSGKVTTSRVFPATDGRHKRPTFTPENRAAVNAALDAVVKPIAARHSATIAQVALAWTIAQPGVTSAIAGARTPEQAIENAGAGDLALSAEELSAVRGAFTALDLGRARRGSLVDRIVRRLLGD